VYTNTILITVLPSSQHVRICDAVCTVKLTTLIYHINGTSMCGGFIILLLDFSVQVELSLS